MIGKTVSHYRIVEKIGGGGMGVVYMAENIRLKKIVALKFLPPDTTRDEDIKHRFMHEARAASALDHPNICTIHDIGETDDGQLFIVMTYYEGATLKSKVESSPLPVDECVSLILQIAKGLSAAHDKGIIHRDIKPDNIMVTEKEEVKLLDFGLVKLAGQTQVTMNGTTLGTAAYMSPEQARGEIVDKRSDIFSLSVIFYQLLTGHHPFEAEHQLATMYAIINEAPAPIQAHNPNIPESLCRIVEKGMTKDVDLRYSSLHEMISDLQNYSSKSDSGKSEISTGRGKQKITITAVIISVMIIVTVFLYVLLRDNGDAKRMSGFYSDQAMTLMEQGDQDAAEKALLKAIELKPDDAATWNTLAALHIRMGKLTEAVEESRRAIQTDNHFSSAYYNLAYALEEQDRDEEAMKYYKEAIQSDSLFTPAYSALGNLYLKKNHPDSALEFLKNAEKRTPDSKYLYLVWKNMGKAYYQNKEYDKAVILLEKSKNVQPVDIPETDYYLSLSFEKLGRIAESKIALESYIMHETDENLREAAQQRLINLE